MLGSIAQGRPIHVEPEIPSTHIVANQHLFLLVFIKGGSLRYPLYRYTDPQGNRKGYPSNRHMRIESTAQSIIFCSSLDLVFDVPHLIIHLLCPPHKNAAGGFLMLPHPTKHKPALAASDAAGKKTLKQQTMNNMCGEPPKQNRIRKGNQFAANPEHAG